MPVRTSSVDNPVAPGAGHVMLGTVTYHDDAGFRAGGNGERVPEDRAVRLADIFDRSSEIFINPGDRAGCGNELAIPDHGDIRVDADRRHAGLRSSRQHRAIAIERAPRGV